MAGTLIHTEDGLVPIEEIKPDQLVWAEDPATGERALKRVVCLFRNEKYELVHLQVNGENITTTVGHPFFVQGKGWVAAKELVVGDKLELLNGGEAYVDAIATEQCAEPVKVYNFEVEDFHTYFVGTGCILVHNMCAKVSNHGNSLNTTKPAKGYILKERGTGKIMKFGETTLGKRRYTVKFLDANKVDMVFVKSGTKRAMHTWQHDMIVNYAKRHGVRPPMNHNWY